MCYNFTHSNRNNLFHMFHKVFYVLLLFFTCSTALELVNVTFNSSVVELEVGSFSTLKISLDGPLLNDTMFMFTYQQVGTKDILLNQSRIVIVPLANLILPAGAINATVIINATHPGSLFLGIATNSSEINLNTLKNVFTEVNVIQSHVVSILIIVIGWIYFVAWSISFYPQCILNFRSKSVVGLNFDFLGLNITGFIFYGLFNACFFWIPAIQAEYQAEHPRGTIPVELNDVVFTFHAVLLTAFTISQCCIYQRNGQRVSRVCTLLLSLMWLFAVAFLFVAVGNKISWLTYLYSLSYIKLGITLIKYIPQAFMNCRRHSTKGWSIGNVLLDFTGGLFSLLQMFLLAYNYDDWLGLFGNPTKFGLGVFSIAFDIVFIVQHYCLFHERPGGFLRIHNDDPNQNSDILSEE